MNHCGAWLGPSLTAEDVEAWKAGTKDVADSCPNVVAKVGGILMTANGWGLDKREKPIGSEELAQLTGPYYGHLIDVFGPSRCMFESNFPVDKDSCSYRTLCNAFKRIVAQKGLTAAQKKDIFHDTAVRTYKLDENFYAKL